MQAIPFLLPHKALAAANKSWLISILAPLKSFFSAVFTIL